MADEFWVNQETVITWTDGGTPDLDLGGLAAGAVRVGQQHDLGAFPNPYWMQWQAVIDGFDTTPVVGEKVHFYIAFANDTSDIDGDVGTADAAGDVNDLPNLLHIGQVAVGSTTAADELITSGVFLVMARYISVVVYNATADALLSTADAHTFKAWPMSVQYQS